MDSTRSASFPFPRPRRRTSRAAAPTTAPARPRRTADPAAAPRSPRARTLVRRLVALAVVLAAVGAAGWWWLKDSSLVAVRDVTVVGVSGPRASAVRAALENAARSMTTLNVQPQELRAAVAGYPVVKDVKAVGDFPHGLRITVSERSPVAGLRVGDRIVPVAGDGTLLRGSDHEGLPTVSVRTPPAGTTLTDPLARAEVRLLAAAPAPLRARVTRVFTGGRGIAVQLSRGPVVAFGAADRLAAKWAALAAVLASPASAGGTLIDLGVPERPAVAGLEPEPGSEAAGASGQADGTAAATAGSSTSATPATDAAGTSDPEPDPTAATPTQPTDPATPVVPQTAGP